MTTPLRPILSLLAITIIGGVLVGCGESEVLPMVRHGQVSEFRTDALERAHSVDTGIANLEEKRAAADSTTGVAFQQTINELLEARRVLQEGLGSLDTLTTSEFEVVTDSLSAQLEFLERRVDGAVFELAPDIPSLREAVRERLIALDEAISNLQISADSSMIAELALLAQRGQAIADSVNATPHSNLDVLRRTIVGDLRLLRTTLDSLRLEQSENESPADSTRSN